MGEHRYKFDKKAKPFPQIIPIMCYCRGEG